MRPRALLWSSWLVALALLCAGALYSRTQGGFADDFLPLREGARNLRVSGDPYLPSPGLPFVYPPSCALLLWPLGHLGPGSAADVGLVLACAALVLLALGCGRLGHVPAPLVVALLALTNLGFGTVQLGNASMLVAAALAAAVVLLVAGRDLPAALLIGLAVAVKPLAAPALLALVPLRSRRGLAVAVAVPVLLNALALPLLRHPTAYLTTVLPDVAAGDQLPLSHNVSVAAWVERASLPEEVGAVLRVLVVVVGLAICVAAVRRRDPVGVVACTTVPVLCVALAGRVDEAHYSLVALPLLAVLPTAQTWLRNASAALAALLVLVSQGPALQLVGQLVVLGAAGLALWPRAAGFDERVSAALVRRLPRVGRAAPARGT